MSEFKLPGETHIGNAALQVRDLSRSLGFYGDALGFRVGRQEPGKAYLSATGQPPYAIVLVERPGARPKPRRSTGLYHVAIRFPDRRELARALQRAVSRNWPLQGASDHKVSEALYLADPDGNGLELYVDRPRREWPVENGQVGMATDPLDVEGLLAELRGSAADWPGLDSRTDIGHVHLHVSDLARAEAFYVGLLGLDVTQRSYPGALFTSAGGYHHHVGLNIWAGVGAPPPPPDAVGLLSFALEIPDGDAWRSLVARVEAAGVQIEDRRRSEYAASVLVRDPDKTGVELLVPLDRLGPEALSELEAQGAVPI